MILSIFPIELGADPLLLQAERILKQRKLRNLAIDADLLGEPAWDILLLGYVARRKGSSCPMARAADELNLSRDLIMRWVRALADRNMLTANQISFSISEDAERKISSLLEHEIEDMVQLSRPQTHKRS